MSDLLERYEAQYGPVASTYLYTLGGDPAAIVAEMERTQAAPEADPLAFLAPLMPTTPEQDAHNAIMREIQRLYFLPISRASALAVCNVLGEAARDLMRKAADDAGKPFEIWFTAYRADRLRRYFSLMYSADAAKIETIFSEHAASKIIDALR